MEKGRKSLFGRLLEFWKEKFEAEETNGIEFWNETETVENHFAEMGAVASLTQEETKKAFWEEMVETAQRERGKEIFFVEEAANPVKVEKEEPEEKRMVSKAFTVEVFRNEEQERENTENDKSEKRLWWEMPEKEKIVRRRIPVTEEGEQPERTEQNVMQESFVEKTTEREEKETETQIDIEKLMRQMTKKLWEEREGCGRRLR